MTAAKSASRPCAAGSAQWSTSSSGSCPGRAALAAAPRRNSCVEMLRFPGARAGSQLTNVPCGSQIDASPFCVDP